TVLCSDRRLSTAAPEDFGARHRGRGPHCSVCQRPSEPAVASSCSSYDDGYARRTSAVSPQTSAVLLDVFSLIVPELVLGLAACVLFLGATFRPNRHLWATVALAALAIAAHFLYSGPEDQPVGNAVFISSLRLDRLAIFIKAVALVSGAVFVLFSWNEVPDRQAAEYHAFLLLIIAGVCLTGAANELVTLFLALELISIPTYILLYLPRYNQPAQEAAIKYFLLSVFSSALLLFGFSYLYGLGGTTNLPA